MGDIQAQLSGVHNTKRYFKDFALESCFIVELRLVNAQHRAGNRKTKRISEQFIKLRYHLYQKKKVGEEYIMNMKLQSNCSSKSN